MNAVNGMTVYYTIVLRICFWTYLYLHHVRAM